MVEGVHARFEHEVSTNVFLTPAAGDPRQRSTKQKLELKNVAGLNFGAFFVLSAKHIRVCYPCTEHIRVCIVFPIFYWQTHARLLSIDQTHTRLLISIFLPNTTHTHSTHTPHTYAFVPLNVANTYAFGSSLKKTYRVCSFFLAFPTKHIRVCCRFN